MVVGDLVKLSLIGRRNFSSGYSNIVGRLYYVKYGDYRVFWSSLGTRTCHSAHHLELVNDSNWVFCPVFKLFYNKQLKISVNINGKLVRNRRSKKIRLPLNCLHKIGKSFQPVFEKVALKENNLLIDGNIFELWKKSE